MLRFTIHAEIQIAVRRIPYDIVRRTIEIPQQRIPSILGRYVYQSRYFDTLHQQEMLMRVVIEPQDEDMVVISVYNTSRIMRYWLEEPR